MGYQTGRYAAAAGPFADALGSDPKLGDDRREQHRYNAACYAVLAAAGQGKDDPPPDDAAKARLRDQALGWLKVERDAWAAVLDRLNTAIRLGNAGASRGRDQVAFWLRHWKADPDLACVRDPDALAKLPEAERKQWQTLWADVDALLGGAGAPAGAATELPADPFAAPR